MKAQILWATLQVHNRINAIIKAGFKSHFVLTTAMSDFIMKNRIDVSQLEAVEKKITVVANDLRIVKSHKVFK